MATLLTAGPAAADPLPPPPLPEPDGALIPGPAGDLLAPDASSDEVERVIRSFAARASAPLPSALPVPDPTDFEAIVPDPQGYGIAPAAERFATGDDEYTIPRPAPGGEGAGTVPDGLEEFYDQQVEWGSCAGFGATGGADECAYVIAPLDYADPGGDTIALAVARANATGESRGAVFTDPGGPGSPGLVLAGSGMFAGLAEDFDTVGIDPRGVGASVPMIRCQSNDAWDRQREGSDGLAASELNAILEYNTDECYENTGAPFGIDGRALIGASGTVNVVKDLDLLRSVLGDEKLNYIGFSYGTSIGYEYARQFPDNIRAMVIDGVVNVLENNPDELAKYSEYAKSIGQDGATAQIAGFQATFEQFLAWCAGMEGQEVVVDEAGTTETFECALYQGTDDVPDGETPDNTVPALLERYRDIARAAWGAQTYSSSIGGPRPLSFADFNQGTLMAMYTEAYWGYLNSGLLEATDAVEGNEDWMMILSDAYAGRGPDGSYSLDLAAFPSIWCTDAGTPPGYNEDTAGIIADLEGYYAAAPFTDPRTNDHPERGMAPVEDWCTYYEDQFTLPAGETLEAMPNVLVVSTTYDSATPYDNGVVAAAAMGATLLTVAGYSHTSYGGSECATQIANAYVDTLVVPADIPGAEGVPTKDVHSNVITGDECMVDTRFRPTPELIAGDVEAGDTTAFDVTGLVRGTAYTATTEFGSATFTTDEHGRAVVAVDVPADATAGTYEVSVVPADPAANDPTVRADATFDVIAAQPSPSPTDTGEPSPSDTGGPSPTDTGGPDASDSPDGADSSHGTDGADGATPPGDLATTGAPGGQAGGLIGLGALLLAAGAAVVLARRRHLAA
ncbi:alpha/beta fold hydrolase [Pseudactinotalea sp. HY160]|uniref:alpha/beta fold hydrolase n=1 Tax=Pseudactinotalea sp. HY160 TaxID=2654490 RepID=UPI00128B7289|nr:alpha/beta fold hydrolase [Pseudactinotalea sp. HY160]